MVITTHYMEEAELLADRVAIIDHGRIQAIASPRELIGRLADSGSIEFATSSAVEIAELAQLSSVNDVKVNGAASARRPTSCGSRSHARRCRRYSTGLSSAASSCAASKSSPAPSKTSSSSSPAASCGSDRQ